jgi:hypothetical protein
MGRGPRQKKGATLVQRLRAERLARDEQQRSRAEQQTAGDAGTNSNRNSNNDDTEQGKIFVPQRSGKTQQSIGRIPVMMDSEAVDGNLEMEFNLY